MRLFEFKSNLFELKMKPGYLEKIASRIDAQGGMEFEMIVPNMAIQTPDTSDEDAWLMDRPSSNINVIKQFFQGGSQLNYNADVDYVISRLLEMYEAWFREYFQILWDANKKYLHRKYFIENIWDREQTIAQARELAKKEYNTNSPTTDDIFFFVDKIYEKQIEQAWEDQLAIDKVIAASKENYRKNLPITKFLEEQYPKMSDIARKFPAFLQWPYVSETKKITNGDLLAQSFTKVVGKNTIYSKSYHSAERLPNRYIIEPDGSLRTDNTNDKGLEFISPVMPVQELLKDLDKVHQWAISFGCYTNDTCGLHMNISINSADMSNLDYVKLALLVGDEHVLEQFGRLTNRFTTSAMKKIRDKIRFTGADIFIPPLLDQIKQGLNLAASRTIHDLYTDKYTSINVRSKEDQYWIEFRSPGGDWLGKPVNEITSTLYRFIIALDAALDPNKYREEYAKKLYKLLAEFIEDKDYLELFACYSAGKCSAEYLKDEIRKKHELEPFEIIPSEGESIVIYAKNGMSALRKARQTNPEMFKSRVRVARLFSI